MQQPAPENAPIATGWKRVLFCALGWCCVGLGYVGIVLPGVPATPFLLAASYFFVRSSPRLHRWLHRSPWIGRVLRDWETHRAVKRSVKLTACCMITTVVSLTLILSSLPFWAKYAIAGFAILGLAIVLRLPTISRRQSPNEIAQQQQENALPAARDQ